MVISKMNKKATVACEIVQEGNGGKVERGTRARSLIVLGKDLKKPLGKKSKMMWSKLCPTKTVTAWRIDLGMWDRQE